MVNLAAGGADHITHGQLLGAFMPITNNQSPRHACPTHHHADKPEGNWIARVLKPSKGNNLRPQSSAGSGCDNCQVLASELASSKKRVDKLEERLVSGGLDHMLCWLPVEWWC